MGHLIAMRYLDPATTALLVCLFILPGSINQASGQTGLRVFADLDHTGQPAALAATPATAADRFAIVAPLPEGIAGEKRLPSAEKSPDIASRLGQLRIEAAANTEIMLNAQGADPASLVLFHKTASGWERATPDDPATWQLTTDGDGLLTAGVSVVWPDITDESAPPAWPTAFSIRVCESARPDETVEVPFRVAPFLIPCSLDRVHEILVTGSDITAAGVDGLRRFSEATGTPLQVHQTRPPADQWMQDAIEPGVFAYPGKPAPQQVPAALTGLRAGFGPWAAALDSQLTTRFDEQQVVTLAPGLPRKRTRWIDWFGNLEVTPPHTSPDGRHFPYGRILTGRQGDLEMHPAVLGFLEAQSLQWPPVVVDTSWLMIGHVDEVVNFVPSNAGPGFKVVLPSPAAARQLLDSLVGQGHGELPVFEGTRDATTVGKLREQFANSGENLAIDRTIEAIRQQLARELQLEEGDFVFMPVLFERGGAVIPNAVNSLVVNGHVLAPEPRGPRLDGKDLFEEAIRAALQDCAVEVHFIDAWRAWHSMGGEVHCGTNTLRTLRDPEWWKVPDSPPPGK